MYTSSDPDIRFQPSLRIVVRQPSCTSSMMLTDSFALAFCRPNRVQLLLSLTKRDSVNYLSLILSIRHY